MNKLYRARDVVIGGYDKNEVVGTALVERETRMKMRLIYPTYLDSTVFGHVRQINKNQVGTSYFWHYGSAVAEYNARIGDIITRIEVYRHQLKNMKPDNECDVFVPKNVLGYILRTQRDKTLVQRHHPLILYDGYVSLIENDSYVKIYKFKVTNKLYKVKLNKLWFRNTADLSKALIGDCDALISKLKEYKI